MVAAAVRRLLQTRPTAPLAVVRYHHQATTAQKEAGQGRPSPAATVLQPVSFYLADAPDAAAYEELRRGCETAMRRLIAEVEKEVETTVPKRDPETGETRSPARLTSLRKVSVRLMLAARGLPGRPIHITGGVIARMGIDAASRRKVDNVILDGVEYAQAVHEQPHRARRDMHDLTR
ncbi:hypothetical protein ACFWYW_30620 [Nonomuraea sp. NPDC059023]|uniref:hypothetical protein n=1 Tax=unclassified Nonomuraea TaxID=2593643 RepID=UPI00368C253A